MNFHSERATMPTDTVRTARATASRPRRQAPSTDAGDKHEAILRGAIRAFARHGFFNAQVADIARAAGVASGTVYLYFQNKDDLLCSIFDRTMAEAIDEGRRALAAVPDPIGRLDEIARLHLERMGRDRDLAIVFQVELRQSIKFMERFSASRLREYLGIIRELIQEGQRTGVLRDGLKPTDAAKLFFGMLDQMATNWVLSRRRYPLEAEAALVVDLFVNGLAARPLAAKARAGRAARLLTAQGSGLKAQAPGPKAQGSRLTAQGPGPKAQGRRSRVRALEP
jgi:TetR/AcrR family transcriptional regulator, fatty acid metabolism regulator protein